jgi:transcriptional regulator with XRE-family HTH domain
MRSYPTILERVALAIPERRVELGLSLNELARVACVSRSKLVRIESGVRLGPPLVVQVALALLVLELHAAFTPPAPVESRDDPEHVVEFHPRSAVRGAT